MPNTGYVLASIVMTGVGVVQSLSDETNYFPSLPAIALIDTTHKGATMQQLRRNVRNFLCGLNEAECRRELEISNERGDTARAAFVQEWIDEEYS